MPAQQYDWILRQIEVIRRMTERLMGKRDPAGIEEALQVSFNLQEKLFLKSAQEFLQLDVAAQVAELKKNESPATGFQKCLTYATLLQETAKLYDFRGNADLAAGARQLALQVALHLALENPGSDAAGALVRALLEKIDATTLYVPVRDMVDEFIRVEQAKAEAKTSGA